ncbi:flagellar biosynthesis protein [Oceanospirillum multiglobuliferum]|uniref:Flagellar biosynthetic protein FlhB n=1 Tax=Oceanospirillum multiglobuliferum TaxID=64969 RepID=A0A1T4L5I3_9GAMM|nr:EscU/YscU/HrcU family type III secretion system export apparatus switch protein [Oceanospirillum multiglobuliferum]OPX56788.1 hypothetical protein BTE48_02625 [Oceanospirillum multiglobuliferum]SJZ50002.1 flagellar biosynthesis protein [Oceanospirillum multiglobuliferum]
MTELKTKQAVALKYDEQQHKAPVVVAKGEFFVAEEILRLAEENGIAIYEDAELVSALGQIELGEEIPSVLYMAIAEIIAFVYHLESQQTGPKTSEDKKHLNKRILLKKLYGQ